MSILLTGGSGFVGSYFLNNSTLDLKSISLKSNRVENIDFKNITKIIHLAALVHQMKGAPDEEYFKINKDLTFDLAVKAKCSGVKQFVFFSTVKVYGEFTKKNQVITENSNCNPQDAYGKSKFEAENMLLKLQSEDFQVSIVRIPLVYGPNVKGNLINLINLVEKSFFLPFGNIKNNRNLVFVGNILLFVEQILLQNKAGIFLVCDESSISTTELVRLIALKLNRKRFLIPIPSLFQRLLLFIYPKLGIRLFGDLRLDNSQTRKELEIDSLFTINDGISKMLKKQMFS